MGDIIKMRPRMTKSEKELKASRTRVSLDLSPLELEMLDKATLMHQHASRTECARAAIKVYAKILEIIDSNQPLYTEKDGVKERIHILC